MATDPLFGIHAESLRLRSQQLELLASNLANADTPNYRAQDLDFKKALEQAAGAAQTLSTSDARHVGSAGAAGAGGAGPATVYRTPLQPSLDGDTVDVPTEQAAFAQSALHYQASLSFIEGRMRSLLTAITGD